MSKGSRLPMQLTLSEVKILDEIQTFIDQFDKAESESSEITPETNIDDLKSTLTGTDKRGSVQINKTSERNKS